MDISILGLGYVGTVSSGCMSKDGHTVIGVDTSQTKVDLINQGKSPIIEKDIDGIIADSVKEGRLSATTSCQTAVMASQVSLVCVGTPSQTTVSYTHLTLPTKA